MKPTDPGYPTPTSATATRIMRANPSTNTRPEVLLRSALHRAGLRFRKGIAIRGDQVRTRPDVVFPKVKVAVYLDGCFWHRCPDHGSTPASNNAYWAPKLDHNVARDRRVDAALSADGWIVVRIWEHEPIRDAVARVAQAVRR
jgi:DNA mismatch endonuclease (patch repair protein)